MAMLEPPFLADRPGLRDAVRWATELHAPQRRDMDRAPFVLHPLEVAALLSGRGFDDDVIAAGLLHDVVENSEASVEDVRARFGERTATIVAALTEDDGIEDYDERKAALRDRAAASDREARAVYAADKIAKARELRAQAARDPAALQGERMQQRLEHYEASLAMLREAGDGHALVDQLAFELWALRTLPPE